MEFVCGCRRQRSPFVMLPVLFCLGVEAVTEVFITVSEFAKLPCDVSCVPEVQYRAVSWYKVADDGFSLSGIVRRDFKANISRRYLGFNGLAEVSSTYPYSLTIHNISSKDLGTYRCSVSAPLGELNKQADVRLLKMETMMDALSDTSSPQQSSTGVVSTMTIYPNTSEFPNDYMFREMTSCFDFSSERKSIIVLVSIVTTVCVALILLMYFVCRRRSTTMKTFTQQKCKKIMKYSLSFGNRLPLYSSV